MKKYISITISIVLTCTIYINVIVPTGIMVDIKKPIGYTCGQLCKVQVDVARILPTELQQSYLHLTLFEEVKK